MNVVRFSVITPSSNQLRYLKRCAASIADQVEGISPKPLADSSVQGGATNYQLKANSHISVHHHIQDGDSTDGTVEWLHQFEAGSGSKTGGGAEHLASSSKLYTFSFCSEPDAGMYDAINRAIENCCLRFEVAGLENKDRGQETANFHPQTSNCHDSVVAWLNCDEQYLPGTLEKVADYFEKHPDVDVVCGDVLVVDEAGKLSGFWKAMPLRNPYLKRGYLYNLSCAMFFRASVFDKGFRFDPSYRAIGDQDLIFRLLDSGIRTGVLREYLSVFTFSSGNISEQGHAKEELEKWRRVSNPFQALERLIFRFLQRSERFLSGCRTQAFPLTYELYVDGTECRKRFVSEQVSAKWPGER